MGRVKKDFFGNTPGTEHVDHLAAKRKKQWQQQQMEIAARQMRALNAAHAPHHKNWKKIRATNQRIYDAEQKQKTQANIARQHATAQAHVDRMKARHGAAHHYHQINYGRKKKSSGCVVM